MHTYFPHFIDAEYCRALNLSRAARLVDHNLKLLALLGARISLDVTMLADSPSAQLLVANKNFRDFAKKADRKFLRIEAPRAKLAQATSEHVSHDAWRRMQEPGWVSSSTMGTQAMVAAARAALDVGFGGKREKLRFGSKVDKIAEQYLLTAKEREILLGTFDLFNWFGTNDLAVTKAKDTRPPTYYEKLVAALEVPDIPQGSARILGDVKDYIDSRAENNWARSAVLEALAYDRSISPRFRNEIRSTVASAWIAAVSTGSTASVSLTLNLPYGVTIPRLLDNAAEAFVSLSEASEVRQNNPALHVIDTLRIAMARVTWKDIANLVALTKPTRELVTAALDGDKEVAPDVSMEHRASLKDEIDKMFPRPTMVKVVRDAAIVSAGVMAPTEYYGRFVAPAFMIADLGIGVFKWSQGRFVAGTLNRIVERLDNRRAQ